MSEEQNSYNGVPVKGILNPGLIIDVKEDKSYIEKKDFMTRSSKFTIEGLESVSFFIKLDDEDNQYKKIERIKRGFDIINKNIQEMKRVLMFYAINNETEDDCYESGWPIDINLRLEELRLSNLKIKRSLDRYIYEN
jgi:hypothetical protein